MAAEARIGDTHAAKGSRLTEQTVGQERVGQDTAVVVGMLADAVEEAEVPLGSSSAEHLRLE